MSHHALCGFNWGRPCNCLERKALAPTEALQREHEAIKANYQRLLYECQQENERLKREMADAMHDIDRMTDTTTELATDNEHLRAALEYTRAALQRIGFRAYNFGDAKAVAIDALDTLKNHFADASKMIGAHETHQGVEIHNCTEVADNPPDLTGRKARCTYYGGRTARTGDYGGGNECNYGQSNAPVCTCEQPSSPGLPFFSQKKDKPFDEFYCGCHGWD